MLAQHGYSGSCADCRKSCAKAVAREAVLQRYPLFVSRCLCTPTYHHLRECHIMMSLAMQLLCYSRKGHTLATFFARTLILLLRSPTTLALHLLRIQCSLENKTLENIKRKTRKNSNLNFHNVHWF